MERVHHHRMRLLIAILAWAAPGCADRPAPLAPVIDSAAALAKQTGPLKVKAIIGLEPLIGSTGDHSVANDINDLGHVVGASTAPGGGVHAVRWNADSSLFPEDLQALPGGTTSEATAINDAGTIIVGWSDDGSDLHAVRWVRTSNTWVIQDLGTLGGSDSRAEDIADDGTIVGRSETMTGEAGFRWQNGFMQGIGIFGIEDALGINDHGQLVGRSANDQAAALFPEHTQLGTLGGATSIATDINDRGEIVGSADDATNQAAAFFWSSRKGMARLGSRGGDSRATAINNAGQIVGVSADLGGNPHAVVWAKGKMLDLGVLPPYDQSGAEAINNNEIVAGWSFTPAVAKRATLWRLK